MRYAQVSSQLLSLLADKTTVAMLYCGKVINYLLS